MSEVSIRDLRNHGGEVVDRVAAGEHVTVTRGGRAVAELRPVAGAPLTSAALLDRFRHLPTIDRDAFRRDVDAVVDSSM